MLNPGRLPRGGPAGFRGCAGGGPRARFISSPKNYRGPEISEEVATKSESPRLGPVARPVEFRGRNSCCAACTPWPPRGGGDGEVLSPAGPVAGVDPGTGGGAGCIASPQQSRPTSSGVKAEHPAAGPSVPRKRETRGATNGSKGRNRDHVCCHVGQRGAEGWSPAPSRRPRGCGFLPDPFLGGGRQTFGSGGAGRGEPADLGRPSGHVHAGAAMFSPQAACADPWGGGPAGEVRRSVRDPDSAGAGHLDVVRCADGNLADLAVVTRKRGSVTGGIAHRRRARPSARVRWVSGGGRGDGILLHQCARQTPGAVSFEAQSNPGTRGPATT